MDTASILKSLSDETRIRIINILYDSELCVCDVMESLGITQTKASRHLAYLKAAGIVVDRKSAQWVYYKLVKSSETRVIELIVTEELRKQEVYKNDLDSLSKWLKSKNIKC